MYEHIAYQKRVKKLHTEKGCLTLTYKAAVETWIEGDVADIQWIVSD